MVRDKDKWNAYYRGWYAKNKDKIAQRRVELRKINKQQPIHYHHKVIERLGGKCIKCGFTDIRALQIDHINGGGNKERKVKGKSLYRELFYLSNEELYSKYQCLCANCQWIKRHENFEHGYNFKYK